ncbi:MAG: hypothetical protein QW101_03120 [Ignisphaera sp.]|uniref:Energy-coupling factor transporter transmembrane protein EcfT n=1 Tax=Ignisphaera aggregans TaxID=334771 RepID=A0A7J3N010_9CREN
MSIIARFIKFLSNALFLYGFSEARLGSTALLTAIVLATAIAVSSKPFQSLVITVLIFLYYLFFSMQKLFIYSALLTSIPSLWMAISNTLVLYLMGKTNIESFLEVFIRAEVFSLSMFYLFHCINIAETSYLVHKISRTASPVIPLLWRSISQILKEAQEIIYVHRLKNEKPWKTLSILFVRGDEMVEMFSEGIYLKRYSFCPRPIYSTKALLFQLLILLTSISLIYL